MIGPPETRRSFKTHQAKWPAGAALISTAGVICGGYVGFQATHDQRWVGVETLAAILAVLLVFHVTWNALSLFLRSCGMGHEDASRQTTFPFIAFLSLMLFWPELFLGSPSSQRRLLLLALECSIFLALLYLAIGTKKDALLSWIETRADRLCFGIVATHFVVFGSLVVLRHYHYGPVLGEDTAYYNQIFWSALHGGFYKGTLTQARYLDTLVQSEFAVHSSPIILLLTPLYAIYPSFYTLLVLRTAALSLSALPLYLLARDILGKIPGLSIICAYYASASIVSQALGAFYPIQFIGPLLLVTFLFFHRERFRPFVVFLILSLLVREEVALTTALYGIYSLFLRRRWHWVVTPLVLSTMWWLVSTKLIMSGAKISMEELDGFFQTFGRDYNEIVQNVLADPRRFARLVVTVPHAQYIYDLLKPAAAIALFSVSSMFLLPTLAMNSIVGGFWPLTLDITMHYSLVATVASFVALVYGIRCLSALTKVFRVSESVLFAGISILLLPLALLSVKDVVGHGQEGLAGDLSAKAYHRTIEQIREIVEAHPGASVVAPSIMLPQLSKRELLYNTNRLWRYGDPKLDYVILHARDEEPNVRDLNRNKYNWMANRIRESREFQLVLSRDGFELYRARSQPGPGLKEIVSY